MSVKSRKVVCVGTGTIGAGWAPAFACAGFDVVLYDTNPHVCASAMVMIKTALEDMQSAGLIENAQESFDRVSVNNDLASALKKAEYVQESVFEDIQVKQEIYRQMDAVAGPDTIIGSSVSSLPASEYMGGLGISSRCIVAHPTNPPYLTPLTEIFCSPWTSDETLERCEELLKEVGQITVRVNKEVKGYVLNRLQAAVVGEALHLVGTGVISAADLDKVMVYGLGMRWGIVGPLATCHLNSQKGFKDYMGKFKQGYLTIGRDLKVDYDMSDSEIEICHNSIVKSLPHESVPEAQRWRDQELMKRRIIMLQDS